VDALQKKPTCSNELASIDGAICDPSAPSLCPYSGNGAPWLAEADIRIDAPELP